MRAALKTLQPHMPSPWSLDGFVHNLADHRGRTIELRAAHFEVLRDGNRTSGMWVEEPSLDVIYWDVTLPALREAAMTLKAPPIIVFWRVILPLTLPGIVIGQVLVKKYAELLETGWPVTEEEIERDLIQLFQGNFQTFLAR